MMTCDKSILSDREVAKEAWDMPKDSNPHGHENQIDVSVNVNGEIVDLRVNENAPVQTLVDLALAKSSNSPASRDRWELRLPNGQQLTNLAAKIGTLGLLAGSRLSMSLAVGAGG